jgi:hypothetical protein
LLVYIINHDIKKNDDINWNKTYLSNDKGPMGAYLFHELLKMRSDTIIIFNKSVYQLSDTIVKNSVIVFYENLPAWTKEDSIAVDKLIKNGNDIIVINSYPGKAFEKFRIYSEYPYDFQDDSLLIKPSFTLQPTFKTGTNKLYIYPSYCIHAYYNRFDSSNVTVFLTNDKKDKFYGLSYTLPFKNKIYFISLADIFLNYFISNHPNRYLIYSLLDYMLPEKKTIIWPKSNIMIHENKSVLDLIFNNKSLYFAWLILLFTLILYAVFDSRRNQKIVPVIEPPENDTLKFVDVVANSYLKSKYHHVVATEKIQHFRELIKKSYHIDILHAGKNELLQLANLSGNSLSLTERLARLCKDLENRQSITDFELLELNKSISIFIKKSTLKT